ncbi:MAG TPA: STM4014 family protein [Chthonomonadaceae bacterium]|nr:STM4014 family protein [Chthonomonadaceae bacterium]
MSRSGSSAAPAFVLLGNPGSRRVLLFQDALCVLGLPPAQVIAWADLLAGRADLSRLIPPGAWVRIESPGRDFPVEQALLALGAEMPDAEEGYASAPTSEIRALAFDKGRILYPRQWFLGFREALRRVEAQLASTNSPRCMNAPSDILTMFDKNACHARLQAAGVSVPHCLAPVRSYNELIARMEDADIRRVFIKLSHGSSASGVVAYRTNGKQQQAITTVERVRQQGALNLYNSRRIRTYTDPQEIAELIEALCRHRIHVEEWIPKASFAGRTFDLRVVVIAGRSQHVVVRQSHTPMTNLHLLNARGDWEALRAELGEAAWSAARQTCEAALCCFPDSLYAGVDLLFTSGFRRHAVLEVNAFGDLLPGVQHNGLDTYAAEIAALIPPAQERPCFPPET